MTLHAAAATYASRYGWQVFPCVAKGKVPLTSDGFKSATSDLEAIAAWWGKWPDANIGIATGPMSGVWVLDVDDLDGLESLVAEHGKLPNTLVAQTGSGGQHWWFTHPDEKIANRAGFWPGLDVRGEGGYVVVPPSLHPNGSDYLWLTQSVVPCAAPDWLVDLVAKQARPSVDVVEVRLTDVDSPWGRRILSEELQAVAQAVDGTRNDVLFRSAAAVFGAVKGGQLPKGQSWDALTAAAITAGLPPREAERTISSAWDSANPRQPAERPKPTTLRPTVPSPDQGSTEERRWPIYDADDLHKIPPPEWLVDGYLVSGFNVLYGPSGHGKSFVAIDWALTIARGSRWLGAETKRTNVVYVAAEGAAGLSHRVSAWKKHHDRPASGLKVIPTRVNLLDPWDVEALERDIVDAEAGLVIIDTLARCMPGADENSQQDMSRVVDALDGLRNRHGCSTLIVHHTGVDQTRMRGSTTLLGATDTVVKVDGRHNEFTDHLEQVELKCDKQKDAAPFPRVTFQPVSVLSSAVLVEMKRNVRTMI